MKERIKAWLKAYNHERDWLADELGVKKRTVDNWLSSPQEIPVGKLTLIERLIQVDEAAEVERRQKLVPTSQVYSIEVDLPTFRLFSKAALAQQSTLEQWSVSELEKAAKNWERAQLEALLDEEISGQTDEEIEHIPKVDNDLKALLGKPEAPSPVDAGADEAAA